MMNFTSCDPEVQHNELNMNEDSNETMNEDKEGSRSTVSFLSQRVLKKLQCFEVCLRSRM
jgi:hypothetical protein